MAVIMTDPESKPDTLRMHISIAYLKGREAFAQGVAYHANPYSAANQYMNWLDFNIGWDDASANVSVEFRSEAEQNGENF